jgi:hypothetical protein
MRDLWYIGAKESFQWLKANDPVTYAAFEIALQPDSSLNNIQKLISHVVPLMPSAQLIHRESSP